MQEKFFWSRIAAHSLLRDRILTRFAQGVGRCTRSDNDYAAVFVVGHRLVEFMLKRENRHLLHPELHAEIEFGMLNSRGKSPENFAGQLNAFFDRDEEWPGAERAIESLREQAARGEESESQQLQAVVSDEAAYVQAKWRGDLEGALQYARNISDALEGGGTKAYRAWWYYLSADAAMALGDETGKQHLRDSAGDLLRRAAQCCPTVAWFARLRRSMAGTETAADTSELNAEAVEVIRRQLTQWGAVGSRFESSIGDIGNNLKAIAHKTFHRGLDGLGRMLGFDSELPEGNAVPDCVWSLGSPRTGVTFADIRLDGSVRCHPDKRWYNLSNSHIRRDLAMVKKKHRIPPSAAAAVRRLGESIRLARRRRRFRQRDMAERMGVSVSTLRTLEAGSPGVSIGNVAMALLVLGNLQMLDELSDAGRDDIGLFEDMAALPERVRVPSERGRA